MLELPRVACGSEIDMQFSPQEKFRDRANPPAMRRASLTLGTEYRKLDRCLENASEAIWGCRAAGLGCRGAPAIRTDGHNATLKHSTAYGPGVCARETWDDVVVVGPRRVVHRALIHGGRPEFARGGRPEFARGGRREFARGGRRPAAALGQVGGDVRSTAPRFPSRPATGARGITVRRRRPVAQHRDDTIRLDVTLPRALAGLLSSPKLLDQTRHPD